jgi:NAD(P)H-hydrate epimerase
MKQATAKQIQQLDRVAIEHYKIESLFLMENAGKAVADEVAQALKNSKNKKIAVFCGKGNNGGDGFVAARYLINQGFEIKNFLLGKVKEITSDAKINFDLLSKMGQEIIQIPDEKSFQKYKDKLKGTILIIDAILGVGLNGEVRQPYKTIINFLNKSRKTIVSVDVPSGLDATTGEPLGICIKANKTVTFGLAKTGFFKNQGSKFVGKLKVADIGWPKELVRNI